MTMSKTKRKMQRKNEEVQPDLQKARTPRSCRSCDVYNNCATVHGQRTFHRLLPSLLVLRNRLASRFSSGVRTAGDLSAVCARSRVGGHLCSRVDLGST